MKIGVLAMQIGCLSKLYSKIGNYVFIHHGEHGGTAKEK